MGESSYLPDSAKECIVKANLNVQSPLFLLGAFALAGCGAGGNAGLYEGHPALGASVTGLFSVANGAMPTPVLLRR